MMWTDPDDVARAMYAALAIAFVGGAAVGATVLWITIGP